MVYSFSRFCALQVALVGLAMLLANTSTGKRRRAVDTVCTDCTQQMQSSTNIWVRNPKRAYGLKSTVELFEAAVQKVHVKYPKTPAIMVGDISFKLGGKMRPHRSHRDGRDIDAGFYFRDGRQRKYFAKPRGRSLDVKRTWALFDALIKTGRVQYIFVGYRIQRALFRHARKNGVSKRRLNRLFQWPRHWRKRAGLIRWERGHDDHFHVRFRRDPAADTEKSPSKGETK